MSLSKLEAQFYLLRVFDVFEITWFKHSNPGGQSDESGIRASSSGTPGWRGPGWS